MRVLIVANHNTGKFSPFVVEQVEAIRKQNIEIVFFGVEGKGFIGYLSNLGKLKKKIKSFNPDIVHAHYGLSRLLANLQRLFSVVTTYLESDIQIKAGHFIYRQDQRSSAHSGTWPFK
jgi:hypothetical protein